MAATRRHKGPGTQFLGMRHCVMHTDLAIHNCRHRVRADTQSKSAARPEYWVSPVSVDMFYWRNLAKNGSVGRTHQGLLDVDGISFCVFIRDVLTRQLASHERSLGRTDKYLISLKFVWTRARG